jgi:hypothetical protein
MGGADVKDSHSLDLPLPFPDAIAPEADPALRAVWQSLFAHIHPKRTFEQAMADPVLRLGIQNAAYYRQRKLECGDKGKA